MTGSTDMKQCSSRKVLCFYNAGNLILTELRFICKVCGNECFDNGYGWLWEPNGLKMTVDGETEPI